MSDLINDLEDDYETQEDLDNEGLKEYYADIEHDKRRDNRLEEIYGVKEPSK